MCFEIEGAPLDVEGYLRTQIPKVPEIPKGPEIGNSIEIVEGSKKEREARLAAAATLLGRAWPRTGYRHSAQLALAGALYHQQWGKEEALEFLCEVCREAGDEDRAKRAATIEHTWARGERGESVAGWTSLEAHIPGSVVKTARELVKRNDIEELRSALKRVPGPGNLGNSGTSQTAAGLPKEIVPGVASAVSALDFLFGAWESEPPPTEFLVEGLIPRECVAMWYGRADSLKTWLLFSMAAALAEGKPWLGRYSTKKCKAGIIDYETGRNNIKKRLFMLRAPKELGAVSFSKLKPNQAEFWTELAKHHFDIVFIDSLRRANQGADENNSGEAIVPLELAAEFADATGCAVVFIHHARKETNDGWPEFRGSAAIEDQVDCAYVVRKTETEGGKKTVEVKCVKPGDMTMPEPFAVSVDFDDVARTVSLGASDKARNFEGKKMSDEEVDAAIELSLMSGPKLRVKDIKENIKVRNERVVDRVDVLKRSGRIRFIEEVGYVLESPEARRARVLACVEERGREWRSEADLARGAYVPTSFVREMLRSGDICKAASGGDVAGFIRVEK